MDWAVLPGDWNDIKPEFPDVTDFPLKGIKFWQVFMIF
jgi:hypothetical protein